MQNTISTMEMKTEEVSDHSLYSWLMIPKNETLDSKTGITIKGESIEYIAAHEKLTKVFEKRGAKFVINEIQLRILDNAKNKPFKIEVTPKAGSSGKVNIKFYKLNKQGIASQGAIRYGILAEFLPGNPDLHRRFGLF